MDNWIGLGFGVVIGAALMVLLKKIVFKKHAMLIRDDPEPIIIIGDGSIEVESPCMPFDKWTLSGGDLLYPNTCRGLSLLKVNGTEPGSQPQKRMPSKVKCHFVTAAGGDVYVEIESQAGGRNVRLGSNVGFDTGQWVKDGNHKLVLNRHVEDVQVILTVGSATHSITQGQRKKVMVG